VSESIRAELSKMSVSGLTGALELMFSAVLLGHATSLGKPQFTGSGAGVQDRSGRSVIGLGVISSCPGSTSAVRRLGIERFHHA
jgi:hypothetical protein